MKGFTMENEKKANPNTISPSNEHGPLLKRGNSFISVMSIAISSIAHIANISSAVDELGAKGEVVA